MKTLVFSLVSAAVSAALRLLSLFAAVVGAADAVRQFRETTEGSAADNAGAGHRLPDDQG